MLAAKYGDQAVKKTAGFKTLLPRCYRKALPASACGKSASFSSLTPQSLHRTRVTATKDVTIDAAVLTYAMLATLLFPTATTPGRGNTLQDDLPEVSSMSLPPTIPYTSQESTFSMHPGSRPLITTTSPTSLTPMSMAVIHPQVATEATKFDMNIIVTTCFPPAAHHLPARDDFPPRPINNPYLPYVASNGNSIDGRYRSHAHEDVRADPTSPEFIVRSQRQSSESVSTPHDYGLHTPRQSDTQDLRDPGLLPGIFGTGPASLLSPRRSQARMRRARMPKRSTTSIGPEQAPMSRAADREDITKELTTLHPSTQNGLYKCNNINPNTGKPCDRLFSRPYDLTRHENSIHRAIKVRCDLCAEERTYTRMDGLNRHYRTCHEGYKSVGRPRK
ncbi:hypothetical protein GQ53DRAFT_807446 [Thozetella sp. PMI_491]|nr:hypothetical protein GQ53DRAFT_807446 [Thozetella sp. PMI_491]